MLLNTTSILAISVLVIAIIISVILLLIAGLFFTKKDGNPLVDQVDAILPQTQCGQCSYPGCRPYAIAIVERGADINQCPPGGQSTIDNLAILLEVESKPLNIEHGQEADKLVAYIREDECIGCTKCIQACPVDAIVGATKYMHTIIVDECTGCDLCVEPCPVDCIDMIKPSAHIQDITWEQPLPLR